MPSEPSPTFTVKPYALARHVDGTVGEVISYPFAVERPAEYVMFRTTPGDPTTMVQVAVADLTPL